jgi:G8 domain.
MHDDVIKQNEHMAAMELVSGDDVTHTAVASGRWCDTSTWEGGRIPGHNAAVLIPAGRTVVYDEVSTATIKTIRVDGTLSFSTSKSSRLRLDTMVVGVNGNWIIGTSSNPVQSGVEVEIIIADNGDIDVDWDPLLLSRGIIAHGHTSIYGQQKTSHVKVASDPSQNDSTLTLMQTPLNWQVGDTIVIAATKYIGWRWDGSAVSYGGSEDEVRTIAAINSNLVTLSAPLAFDHHSPRSDLKTSVANFTRSVTIRTENADQLPVHRRGHVMFMHSNDVDVRYAEFHELGRTDKSIDSQDIEDIVDSATGVHPDSNARGRYSFHFHRSGTADHSKPAIAVGNAVFGSPGWGYVHHDSHAMFHNNASFNTHGAGFVAETGNEIGIWSNNIAIRAKGNKNVNPKLGNDEASFDIARSGDGFWFQGRLVKSFGNIAASVGSGFTYFHRDHTGTMIYVDPNDYSLSDAIALRNDSVHVEDTPIRSFTDNEALASKIGLFVGKANPEQGHDIYTVLANFTAWEVKNGVNLEYTGHYLLHDFDLIGATGQAELGVEFGQNTFDMVVANTSIENFSEGVLLSKVHAKDNERYMGHDQYALVGVSFKNVETEYLDYDSKVDQVLSVTDLVPGRFSVSIDNVSEDLLATGGGTMTFSGSKADSIGTNPLPGGGDVLTFSSNHFRRILSEDGYYIEPLSGDYFVVFRQYFSDRATGELHKYGFKVRLTDEAKDTVERGSWEAQLNGEINLLSVPPVAGNDVFNVDANTDVTLDLIANDLDVDGDKLTIDSYEDPIHGYLFYDSSARLTYRPAINYVGTDTFNYWVSDNQGNISKANVSIRIGLN